MKHNNITGYMMAGFAVLGLAACSSHGNLGHAVIGLSRLLGG